MEFINNDSFFREKAAAVRTMHQLPQIATGDTMLKATDFCRYRTLSFLPGIGTT